MSELEWSEFRVGSEFRAGTGLKSVEGAACKLPESSRLSMAPFDCCKTTKTKVPGRTKCFK